MQGMAAWKSAGAQYVGITYESDRPVFQCEVPNGGLDIQDEQVYWHFASGAACYSLRQLYTTPESDFKLYEEDEPYLAIGRKMGWDLLGICENEVHLAEYDLITFLVGVCLLVLSFSLFSFGVSTLVFRLGICRLAPPCVLWYLNDRGTLADERWKALTWSRPANETAQCWWLVIWPNYVVQFLIPSPTPSMFNCRVLFSLPR